MPKEKVLQPNTKENQFKLLLASLLEFEQNTVSREEFVQHFESLVTFVKQVSEKNKEQFGKLSDELTSTLEEFKANADNINDSVQTDASKRISAALSVFETEKRDAINRLDDRVANVQDGKDADEEAIILAVLSQIRQPENGTDGKDGSPDTPEQIRDKLQTLKKNDRLDKSAIKGLEKMVDEENLNRAISILDQRTQFLINKQTSTSGITNITGFLAQGTGTTLTGTGTLADPYKVNASASGGSVTSISIASANGFTGSSDGDPATPTLTIATSVTGLLKGNGTAISAAVQGTDYLSPTGVATVTNKDFTSGTNTFPTFNQNTTGSAAKLTTARTIGIVTGDATSAGSTFDGTANNTNALTLTTVNSNVGSFTAANITVDAKGRITAAANGSVQAPITLTTTGTSGAATFIANTLNIPNYSSGSGGITRSVNNASTTTSAGATAATDYVYFCTGTFTITLPTAVGNTNRYAIKNVSTGVITIATTSAQTIDGSTTAPLPVQYTSLDLVSDGANWNIV